MTEKLPTEDAIALERRRIERKVKSGATLSESERGYALSAHAVGSVAVWSIGRGAAIIRIPRLSEEKKKKNG